MASLTGNKVKNTYKALLKFFDNDSVSVSLKQLTDGLGNAFPFFASTSVIKINNNTYPTTDGNSGDVMTTDGAGTLTLSAPASQDPTMGGDLTGTASNAQIAAGAIGSTEIGENAVGIPEIAVTDGTNGQLLSTDGSGLLSFTSAGAGDVTKVNTPVDNELGVWTGDGTLEGASGVTWDGSSFTIEDGFLSVGSSTYVTISSGAITVNKSYVEIDTESSAITDDLDTINNTAIGRVLYIAPANDGRDVVVKHETGNIHCPQNSDITLNGAADMLQLVFNGSRWIVVGNSEAT